MRGAMRGVRVEQVMRPIFMGEVVAMIVKRGRRSEGWWTVL